MRRRFGRKLALESRRKGRKAVQRPREVLNRKRWGGTGTNRSCVLLPCIDFFSEPYDFLTLYWMPQARRAVLSAAVCSVQRLSTQPHFARVSARGFPSETVLDRQHASRVSTRFVFKISSPSRLPLAGLFPLQAASHAQRSCRRAVEAAQSALAQPTD